MQVPPFSLSQQLAELGPELDAAVLKVLRSGQYIGGSEIQAFEEAFAKEVGVPYAVGCNSGTDALILALRALGIGAGDEVISCSFSFFATAEAISAVGATPVFVDVEPDTYLINLEQIEAAITPATRALLPVHLFGRPVNMDQLMAIALKHGLKVIEDCAQASGAAWNGRPVGSWGDVGCFSFFPTKNLGAAGDGGAVTTHDAILCQQMRELAVHGMPRRYLHTQLGYNSRLDALQAAVLNVKLPCLSGWIEKRQTIAERYQEHLADLPGLELPDPASSKQLEHGWNQYVVRVTSCPNNHSDSTEHNNRSTHKNSHGLPSSGCRDWLKQNLQEQGVNTIIYYPIPIHQQPAYETLGYEPGSLPITEQFSSQVLSLPIFPELSLKQQDRVVTVLQQLLLNKPTTPHPQAQMVA
ncbi:MAG TPA: DegT/DnrJ/EryC1/StrS family aminotransferase [Prochlorococcaceae cyanobacterium Fu_MAG_72]|nr:DegT/DnrJ/EryC1/StrS family aminotransferase [Prochlorococcaceae cyanobacterium Fu_MAG_72]